MSAPCLGPFHLDGVELNPCYTVLLTLKDLTSLKLLVTRKMSTKSQEVFHCLFARNGKFQENILINILKPFDIVLNNLPNPL